MRIREKTIMTLMTAAGISLLPFMVEAYDFEKDGVYYNFVDNGTGGRELQVIRLTQK